MAEKKPCSHGYLTRAINMSTKKKQVYRCDVCLELLVAELRVYGPDEIKVVFGTKGLEKEDSDG